MTDTDNKSRAQRVTVSLKVNLKLETREQFEAHFAQNISRSGIFIRAKEPVPVGSRVKFEYLLADATRILRGMGIVRWVRSMVEADEPEEPPGMGIEFVDVDPQTDALVNQIVAKHGEGARAPRKELAKRPLAPRPMTAPRAEAIDEEALDHEETDALDLLLGDTAGPKAPVPSKVPRPEPGPGKEGPAAEAAWEDDLEPPLAETTGEDDLEPPLAETAGEDELELPLAEAAGAEAKGAPAGPEPPLAAQGKPLGPPKSAAKAGVIAKGDEELARVQPGLWLDLCGADLLVAEAKAGALADRTLLSARFAIENKSLKVDAQGAWLAHPLSWLTEPWPSPRSLALARRVGIPLRPGGAEPALAISGVPIPIALAIQAAVATAVKEAKKANAGAAHVLVPAHASEGARAAVVAALAKVGIGTATFVSGDLAVMRGAKCNTAPGQPVLVIQLGIYETRLGVVAEPDELLANRQLPDVSTSEADRLLFERGALALLRDHGTDIEDDPTLHLELLAQAQRAHESCLDGSDWCFALAGGEVTLSHEELVMDLMPLTERLTLACEAILNDQLITPGDLGATIFAADAPPWPGLLRGLKDQLGLSPTLATDGAWARIRGGSGVKG